MRCKLLAIILVVCILSSSAICAPPSPGYVKIWEDTFSGGSLNNSNWTIGLRDPGTGDLVPGAWGAGLLGDAYAGYITAEDVSVSNGSLYLQNQKRNYTGTDPAGSYSYTSGWVMSMHKVYFNKGYIEFRAQFPAGDKVWPALWLISENLIWCPEWDMWEYFGWRDIVGYDAMGTHLCYDPYPSQQWQSNYIMDFDTVYGLETWHVYGFEWTQSYAKWYIDDVEVHHLDNTIGSSWPDEDMYIVLNNGVKVDSPDTTTAWPNNVIIDYVELYEDPTAPDCENGVCESGEDCNTCSADCIGVTSGNPRNRYCCGDGTCEGAENETNCAVDCGGGGSYCDDGTCDPGEDQCNCPQDCGTPPATETNCNDGIDEDCDSNTDCNDPDCLGDPACPTCGDGNCDPGEDQCNCSVDCGPPPSTETNCTDGINEDCDADTDCDDSDCNTDPACQSMILVGGSTLNGDFNNPDADSDFDQLADWVNIGTGPSTMNATQNTEAYDGTRHAFIGYLPDVKIYALDTGYTIAQGDSFDISYVWKDGWLWTDGTDQVRVSLFVTNNNTINGVGTDLVVDLSGLSTADSTYEAVDHDGIYTASAADAGKTLFVAIDATITDESYAPLDNFELIKTLGSGSYCGDATCDPGEDQCNCSDDCGSPPSTETNCTDGINEDCDTDTDCDDSDCASDPACDCLPPNADCTDDAECCSNNCRGNGRCR